MTVHPEISHIDKEERIRLIAYAIWEEEGRPEGRDEAHWLQASELVETEAASPATDPDWLQRNEGPVAVEPPPAEPKVPLSEAIKRMRSSRAA